MIIQMVVLNKLGEFYSEQLTVTETQYSEMIEMSKKFFIQDNGFEMWTESGFIIIPPEITKKSILSINVIEYDPEESNEE